MISTQLKPWHPKKVRARHKLVAALAASGLTNNEIASQTGYTPSRISILLSHPVIQGLVDSYVTSTAKNIRDRFEDTCHEALDTVIYWMRQQQFPNTSQRSALEILDRAGYSKVDKQITGHISISPDKADKLVEAVVESSSVNKVFKYDGNGRDLGPKAPGSERVLQDT